MPANAFDGQVYPVATESLRRRLAFPVKPIRARRIACFAPLLKALGGVLIAKGPLDLLSGKPDKRDITSKGFENIDVSCILSPVQPQNAHAQNEQSNLVHTLALSIFAMFYYKRNMTLFP